MQVNADDYIKNIISSYEKNMKNGFKFISVKWSKKAENILDPGTDHGSDVSMNTIKNSLGSEKHLMLLGEAGCGKTTSIEYLEYMDAKEWKNNSMNPLPVMIRLSDATDLYFSIEDQICAMLDIPVNYCQKLLSQGSISLYLDGVNEMIASNEVKKKVVIQIEKMLAQYPNTYMVITDRENVEVKISTRVPTFYLRQMDKDDITSYISQKADSNSQLTSAIVSYAVKMIENGVAFTPIVLNFLFDYAKTNNHMPETSTDFFKAYIKSLFRRENEEKKDINAAPGRLDSLLMYLAIHMPEEGMANVEVLRIFAKCKQILGLEELDTRVCLNLALQLGVLEENDERITFANDDFQGCFLADALDKGMVDWDD